MMNPRRNKCTFCKHFVFVGSDVSPVFLLGVESICAMLPYRQLLSCTFEYPVSLLKLGIVKESLTLRPPSKAFSLGICVWLKTCEACQMLFLGYMAAEVSSILSVYY